MGNESTDQELWIMKVVVMTAASHLWNAYHEKPSEASSGNLASKTQEARKEAVEKLMNNFYVKRSRILCSGLPEFDIAHHDSYITLHIDVPLHGYDPVMIARIQNHEPVKAVLYDADSGQLWWATKGEGAYLSHNDPTQGLRLQVPVRVSRERNLNEIIMGLQGNTITEQNRAYWSTHGAKQVHIEENAGHCITEVASSVLDAALCTAPHYTESAPAQLILTEAGGVVRRCDGTNPLYDPRQSCICGTMLYTNGACLDALLCSGARGSASVGAAADINPALDVKPKTQAAGITETLPTP